MRGHVQEGMKRVYGLDVYKPAEALLDMARHDFDKGSLKNNLTFWHLIFRSFSVDFKEQKP